MSTPSDSAIWENWCDAYFMRKRPTRKKPAWEDLYVTLSHENTSVRFYNSGMVSINGDVKYGAIAFAKHILELGASGSLNYMCMKIHLKKDSQYSLEWVGEENNIYNDINYKEPKFWEEFKREFERYCELKAFL